jgi:putative membrane protein
MYRILFRGKRRSICGGHRKHEVGIDSHEILNRRYAKGEISVDEYQRMKKEIE